MGGNAAVEIRHIARVEHAVGFGTAALRIDCKENITVKVHLICRNGLALIADSALADGKRIAAVCGDCGSFAYYHRSETETVAQHIDKGVEIRVNIEYGVRICNVKLHVYVAVNYNLVGVQSY